MSVAGGQSVSSCLATACYCLLSPLSIGLTPCKNWGLLCIKQLHLLSSPWYHVSTPFFSQLLSSSTPACYRAVVACPSVGMFLSCRPVWWEIAALVLWVVEMWYSSVLALATVPLLTQSLQRHEEQVRSLQAFVMSQSCRLIDAARQPSLQCELCVHNSPATGSSLCAQSQSSCGETYMRCLYTLRCFLVSCML